MITPTLLLGAALLVLGCIGHLYVRSRIFRRRSIAGVQCFRSYSHMLWARFVDRTLMLASWTAGAAGVVLAIYPYLPTR